MSAKIYIGNLGWNTNDGSLRDVFAKYGSVLESTIVRDRETGRCRGFAYVTYSSADEASAAIKDLNAQELDGRRIKVDYASNRLGGGEKVTGGEHSSKSYEAGYGGIYRY